MEVFGAVAASCALGGELLRLSRVLRKMMRSVKHARRDIEDLSDEIDMFVDLYQSFMTTCNRKRRNKKKPGICASFPLKQLKSWTESVTSSFKALISRVGAPLHDPKSSSLVRKTAAYVEWYFSQKTVEYLRASLNVARESMTGFTNVVMIENLDEQLRHLQAALRGTDRHEVEQVLGMSIEEAIKNTKQARENCLEQRLNNTARLTRRKEVVIKYQREIERKDLSMPDLTCLLDCTNHVEYCVAEVPLPRSQSRQTRYSSPPSNPSVSRASRASRASSVTSCEHLTPSNVRASSGRARRGPRELRIAVSQCESSPDAVQVRADRMALVDQAVHTEPAHAEPAQQTPEPVVSMEGQIVLADGCKVGTVKHHSMEAFMRDIGNDNDKLAAFVKDVRSGSTEIGDWEVT